MLTVTQLNAYFYMMGIFESVQQDKDTTNDRALLYFTSWFEELRRANPLNMRNFDVVGRGRSRMKRRGG